MEAARHKLIKYYDDQEEVKKKERYDGLKVIKSQIAVKILMCFLNDIILEVNDFNELKSMEFLFRLCTIKKFKQLLINFK